MLSKFLTKNGLHKMFLEEFYLRCLRLGATSIFDDLVMYGHRPFQSSVDDLFELSGVK